MSASLGQFLDAASAAVRSRNRAQLANLLDVSNADASRAVSGALASERNLNLGALCNAKVPAPFDEIFANHCQCLAAVAEGRHEDAFSAITAAIHAFVKDFKNQETAWSLDALVRLVRAAKDLAVVAG